MTPGKRFIDEMIAANKQFSLILEFAENYPFDVNRPEILTRISYKPIFKTAADQTAFGEQVTQKYGPPTSSNQGLAVWCVRAYENRGPNNLVTFSCGNEVPHMSAGPFGIELEDTFLRANLHKLWDERRSNIAAPPL
jgi:hypothetical protein